tara:strand:- start:1208 stop:1363 length:156 start_codon:yes stop_codon:yes gene_type:complete
MTQQSLLELWPIISALGILAAGLISFRSEVLLRLKFLEEKIRTVFELLNKK